MQTSTYIYYITYRSSSHGEDLALDFPISGARSSPAEVGLRYPSVLKHGSLGNPL